LYRIYI